MVAVTVAASASAWAQAGKAPLKVVVEPARQAPIADTVEALGTTRPNESVTITANVSEKIRAIRFDDGQRVAKGDVLVELENAEEEAALSAAEAVAQQRRAAYDRALTLGDRKYTARAQIDERRAALEEAAAQVEAVRSRLRDRTIKAPFDGIVGLRNISVGTLVEPGDAITELYDLSVMKLDFEVPAVYLSALRPGLEIAARTAAFGDRPFHGEVSSVAPRVDPVTRSVEARALVPNPDGALRPGLLMTVELMRNPRRAVVIPEEAVVPRGHENFVYVVSGDPPVAERRRVELGTRRSGEVEVRDGVAAGDRLVTHGTMQVGDGMAVEILREDPPPADDAGGSVPGRIGS